MWTYHTSHKYKDIESNSEVSFISQLYRVGVYGIVNNDSANQFNMTPKDIVKLEKALKNAEKLGLISNLEFGREIKVKKIDGFFVEI